MMQFEYRGLDQKAEKINLFPEIDGEIKLPLNCQTDPFDIPKTRKIRAIDLLKFKNVFVSSEGAVFKGLSISEESTFHEGVKKFYEKKSDRFRFFKRNYLKRKTIKIKKAMLASDPWSLINYYHWLCDSLPRLAAGILHFSHDMFLIIPYEKHSIKNEIIFDSLKSFGIDEKRILKLERNQKVKVEELLIPTHIRQHEVLYFRSEIINLIRNKIINFYSSRLSTNLGDKIYISRSKASYRKISNENELVALLKKYGFAVVNMEDYSLIEQISIAHHARYLLSCHGAGLTNILFMKENGFVLELINKNLSRPHFYSLASSASLNYLLFKCQQASQKNFDENSDIIVDLNLLEKSLKNIIF